MSETTGLRPAITPTLALLMLIPGFLWGLATPLTALALRSYPPISLAIFRASIACLLLTVFMYQRGTTFPKTLNQWFPYIVLGVLNNAIPFVLTSWAQLKIEAGLTAILVSLMPLFTALIATYFLPDEKLTTTKLLGLIVAFGGIFILIGPSTLAGITDNLFRQLIVIFSAFSYGLAAVYGRIFLQTNSEGLDTITTVAKLASCQYLTSSLILIPLSLIIERPWTLTPTMTDTAVVLLIGSIVTIGAVMIYYYAIDKIGATFGSMTIYLIPISGVIWSAILLGEQITATAVLALIIILGGVALANQ